MCFEEVESIDMVRAHGVVAVTAAARVFGFCGFIGFRFDEKRVYK